MQNIVVDAGPLIALFDGGDSRHRDALHFFKVVEARLVTNIAVIAETAHMLSFSTGAVVDFLGWVGKTFQIDTETIADLPRTIEIMGNYADLPADFAGRLAPRPVRARWDRAHCHTRQRLRGPSLP